MNIDLWKKRKKELRLTFQDLSEKSGLAISTLKAIFGGVTFTPRIDTVEAIERALGIIPNSRERATVLGEPLTDEEIELIALSRKTNPLLRTSLIQALRAIIEPKE